MNVKSKYLSPCLFYCWLLGCTPVLLAQETVTLSGYIRDAGNGETLIGATVYLKELVTGTTTNAYGFYSISVPQGTYSVSVTYVSFEKFEQVLALTKSQKLDVELKENSQQLTEVVVLGEAEDANISTIEMSLSKMDIQTIEKIPALLGEVDIIKSIQLLPGVSTVGEGATGFNVRGGGVGQNIILLDEAPIYNSSHLFGFFSIFNPDAVKDVKLIKGGIPAQYGGRVASVLDVRMKEGNNKNSALSGGIGTIFSRLTVEGPIKKDKASFIVSGRRSYIDILVKPFLPQAFSGSKFYFYDLTMKANVKLNKNNRIFLSGYLGRDVFGFGKDVRFSWGNTTTTFRWNHLFNDRLFSNLTVYYADYDYALGFGDSSEGDSFDWKSSIVNYSIKSELSYFPNPKHHITFGGQTTLYNFKPAKAIAQSDFEFQNFSLDNKYVIAAAFYLGDEYKVNKKLILRYGLRLSLWNYIGPGESIIYRQPETPGGNKIYVGTTQFKRIESIKTYANLEPRFSLKYQMNTVSAIKASYNRLVQYHHLISNGTASNPLDIWIPSTNNIKPNISDQIALGYFRNFKENTFEVSTEIYYKSVQNEVDYVDGADLLINERLAAELLNGQGRAYGLEVYIKKNKGRLQGWLSYTLSRSERKVLGINNNTWYPNRFDKLHSLALVGFYEFSKRCNFSANFIFNTGTPATFYTNRIRWQGYVYGHSPTNSRNNFRLDPYHRLDLSLTLAHKKNDQRRWKQYFVFSCYNTYSRKNPFSIFFQQQKTRPENGIPITTQAVQFSVVGQIIPAITYNFKF